MLKNSLRLTNHTGHLIHVQSLHTGRVFSIKDKRSATIPHSSGGLIVHGDTAIDWHYANVRVPDNRKIAKYTRLIVPEYRLYLSLEPDGTIYVLPVSHGKEGDYRKIQPPGFPLLPEHRPDLPK
jgi:hypothetical protein